MEYLEMCDQCLVNPIYFGQPLIGFTLARARRDGCEDWKKGEWGLIEVNDPTYVFSTTPMNDNLDDLIFAPPEFRDGFYSDAVTGHKLYMSCLAAGFNPLGEDNLMLFLYKHLAQWIKDKPFEEGDDPFPHLEEKFPTDITITNQPYEI